MSALTSPTRTERSRPLSPTALVWICQRPQSKSHFPARRSVLSALDLNAPLCRFLTQTPAAPFHEPFHISECLSGLRAFSKGSPTPYTLHPRTLLLWSLLSDSVSLLSSPVPRAQRWDPGVPTLPGRTVPPSSTAGSIIHSRSGLFLEDDSLVPASPWLTLTLEGGHPLQHLNLSASQVLSPDPGFHPSLSTATSWAGSSPVTAMLSKVTDF